MMIRTVFLALAVTAALSACDGRSSDSESQAQTAETAQPEATFDQKFNLYISGYNMLIGDQSGLAKSSENYNLYNIPEATALSTLDPGSNMSYYASGLRSLQEAKAMESEEPTAEIDAAIDRLTPPMEELVSLWQELEPYYSGRAYRQDDVAKGKAADAAVKAAYAESLAALDELGESLLVVQRERGERRLVRLREAGHVAEASLVEALQKGDLLATAVSRGDLDEAARVAPELDAVLAAMRENAEEYGGPEHARILYGSVTDTFTRMLGAWRDFEANQNEVYLQSVIANYNMALRSASSIPLPS
ncbi:DUF3829 domain-containing protein [Aliihoeflea sp. PC F10.4]